MTSACRCFWIPSAKVEVLGWYARICMFGAYMHTKNAPCGAL